MVVKPKETITARPVVLNIADVPVAVLPMIVAPLKSGRKSGLLTPKFGGDQVQGYYMSNLGFYYAPNDYWDAMAGGTTRALYDLTAEEGFVGLAWLDAGSRCFYTTSKKIAAPADLQGLRIASAKPELAQDMLAALGAECVPMAYDASDGTWKPAVVERPPRLFFRWRISFDW